MSTKTLTEPPGQNENGIPTSIATPNASSPPISGVYGIGGRPRAVRASDHAHETDDREHLRQVQNRERSKLILRPQEEDRCERDQAEPGPVLRLRL